jgi:hypothetical protein
MYKKKGKGMKISGGDFLLLGLGLKGTVDLNRNNPYKGGYVGSGSNLTPNS